MRGSASAMSALVMQKKTPLAAAVNAKTAAAKGHARDQAAALNPLVTAGEQRKRHRAAEKAARTRKRNAAKRRGVSPDGIALCPAEAVAQCARLAGWDVSARDVLDLYARCADGPSSGFTIAAALTAGLRGATKPGWEFLGRSDIEDAVAYLGDMPRDELSELADESVSLSLSVEPSHALILGVDLPGPHALTVAPDGTWWSWGEPFRPQDWPEMAVEEAWIVGWAA